MCSRAELPNGITEKDLAGIMSQLSSDVNIGISAFVETDISIVMEKTQV